MNRSHGLWSLISKCKKQMRRQSLNEKDKKKHSELTASFVSSCNLKGEQAVSELQLMECAVIPLRRESQLEGNSQEMHVRNVMDHDTSEIQTCVKKDQLFVYVFSPGTESWEMKLYDRAPYGQSISVPKPQFSCLAHSLRKVRLSRSHYIILKGDPCHKSHTLIFCSVFRRNKYARENENIRYFYRLNK